MLRSLIRYILSFFPKVSYYIRRARDLVDTNKPALKTKWGFSLAGHKEMAEGKFEEIETKLVLQLLPKFSCFVNVGANIGYYCAHALNLGVPTVAVEPSARNLHYLLGNIKENNWEDMVKVFPVALGLKPSVTTLWGSGTGASLREGWAGISSSHYNYVSVLTLDMLLASQKDLTSTLVLIDVEGFEQEVLLGAVKTLEREVSPVWIIEITTFENQPEGVMINPQFLTTFDIFFSRGYKAYKFIEGMPEFTQQEVKSAAIGEKSPGTYSFLFSKNKSHL